MAFAQSTVNRASTTSLGHRGLDAPLLSSGPMRQNTLQRAADDLRFRFVLNELVEPQPIWRPLPPSERNKPIPWSPTTKWYATGSIRPERSPSLAHSALAHSQYRDKHERRCLQINLDAVR